MRSAITPLVAPFGAELLPPAARVEQIQTYITRFFYSDPPILVIALCDPTSASGSSCYVQRVKAIDRALAALPRIYTVVVSDCSRAVSLTRRQDKLWVLEMNDRDPIGEVVIQSLLELGANAYVHSIIAMRSFSIRTLLPNRSGALLVDLHGHVPEQFGCEGSVQRATASAELERYAAQQVDRLICASKRMATRFIAKHGRLRNEPIICPIFADEEPIDTSRRTYDDQRRSEQRRTMAEANLRVLQKLPTTWKTSCDQITAALALRRSDHLKLEALDETGFVVLHDYSGPSIPEREWQGLEYIAWKSGGDTNFAPIASAHGDMECGGFWDHGKPDKDGVWTKNAESCPTLVEWTKSIGANFGRVRIVKLTPNTEADAIRNMHRDNNNALNPKGEGWVVRVWLQLSDDPDSYMILRERKDDPSTEFRIALRRHRQIVIDSQRLFHAVCHPGPEPRYALIASFESGTRLQSWMNTQRAQM